MVLVSALKGGREGPTRGVDIPTRSVARFGRWSRWFWDVAVMERGRVRVDVSVNAIVSDGERCVLYSC